MRPAPAATLSPLETAVWRTVAYVDLFDYPLTAAEIYRYLEGTPATPERVDQILSPSAALAGHLGRRSGYFCLPGRENIVEIRQARLERARALWPRAVRYGRLMARLPFVRLVAVTGSLAMNNVTHEADIDYFLVTENGRLWLARALSIGIVRLAARQGTSLCPNYFVAESALTLPERNLYTAREIAQMVPLFGLEVYRQFRRQNGWVARYLPNACGPPAVRTGAVAPARWPQALIELPLRTPVGLWLEQWEQTRKVDRLSRQQNGAGESYFSAIICKGHFQAHQQRTLRAYRQRLDANVKNEPPS